MQRFVLATLTVLFACEPQQAAPAPVVATTAASAPTTSVNDSCQVDIPDCEAACAMRESHRTQNLEWFDRRCAAVVLGKNPDKAVPPVAHDAGAHGTKPAGCETPFSYDANGVKKWKLECVD